MSSVLASSLEEQQPSYFKGNLKVNKRDDVRLCFLKLTEAQKLSHIGFVLELGVKFV